MNSKCCLFSVWKLFHIETLLIERRKDKEVFLGQYILHIVQYRGWNYSRTSDIFRAFVALVRTKSVCSAKLSERRMRTRANVRERARVIAAQSLDARLAHGYTASKCPSRYPVMKRSRSYCQTVTWLYRQTVSQATLPPGTRDCIAPPISGAFRASLSFAWLAVHWQSCKTTTDIC